ncbi:MAG: hypothetical protein ACI4UK_03605 [Floccifex sp.]
MKAVIWLVLLLSCTSCAGPQAIPATDYLILLQSVKDLLSFCILIIGSDPCYRIQLMPRYYYAIYNLARLVYNNTENDDSSNHTHTWKKMPSSLSNVGLKFKYERINNDYHPYIITDKDLSNQLSMIETSTILDDLVSEVRNTVNQYKDGDPNFNNLDFANKVNAILTDIQVKNSDMQKQISKINNTQSSNP